ncbi:hypothetical protein [Nocardioides pinisoli]|uniref:DUF4190 domain-containing protein n=1 Tax=Nocardioides pinisoli TaxID=2950279 RepID=A0ABT1L1B2_9ACTN|nr:hypothetical protein [Nocardioides pinisoli]MCP3423815.1 hypothetical protein [Nocardioides pinisoli]
MSAATPVPEKGTLSAARASRTPKNDITALFALGILLLVFGLGLMVGNWPGVEPGYFGPRETGNEGGAIVGALMAGVGQILLFIAIIATGVRLGIRAD